MAVAALITWLIAAAGGFYLLATWIAKGGTRERASRFPPAVIFGHFGLAVVGLVLWIIYLFAETDALAWTAFIVLLPVAVLGFTMFARWLPTYRARAAIGSGGGSGASAGAAAPESQFPVVVVGGHGVFAVATVVLVLLTALGVGT